MSLLLDTCVVSEASKARQNSAVREWLANQHAETLHISALTIGELHYGARLLGDGKRRRELETWIATIHEDFEGRILALDETIAGRWGQLRVHYPNAPIVDSQIAATALACGFTLVTRNVKDFAFDGLTTFNPWKE